MTSFSFVPCVQENVTDSCLGLNTGGGDEWPRCLNGQINLGKERKKVICLCLCVVEHFV